MANATKIRTKVITVAVDSRSHDGMDLVVKVAKELMAASDQEAIFVTFNGEVRIAGRE